MPCLPRLQALEARYLMCACPFASLAPMMLPQNNDSLHTIPARGLSFKCLNSGSFSGRSFMFYTSNKLVTCL